MYGWDFSVTPWEIKKSIETRIFYLRNEKRKNKCKQWDVLNAIRVANSHEQEGAGMQY